MAGRLADGVEPLGEPFALAIGESAGEGPDVAGEGVKDPLALAVTGSSGGTWMP
ncbi:hypothetical protein ACGFWI_37105 [Streptomyces sp. NPDC048434]|uniref:hypothetical protein n=1 Tax=Streptomyces sp. NPDC048434 TaxID=3365549 RepID=UPI00371C62CD